VRVLELIEVFGTLDFIADATFVSVQIQLSKGSGVDRFHRDGKVQMVGGTLEGRVLLAGPLCPERCRNDE
jgi:hypothetical protein